MPAPPDNSGWASWLSQFLPQIGAPQLGNILNGPAAGPTLGRIGLPQALGGNGVYQPPQQSQQPGPPMQLGPNAMPPGPMDPSIMAQQARMGPQGPAGGATGSWGPAASPAATSTATPGSGALGGIGSDARFPLTSLGGATGSWGPPSGQGGIGSDYVAGGGAPMSGAPPNTSPSGPGPTVTSPGRPSVPPGLQRPAPIAGAMAPNSPFVQIARPNADAIAGVRGAGAPTMSALDLSRLFGNRGAPAAAPGVIPASATASVPPAAANPNNPYWGPNTAGRAAFGGPIMPNDITGYPVAGVNAPMQPSMNPNQLASAVRNPNWWQSLFGGGGAPTNG